MTVPDIHRGVLDNLLDGVLVVGGGGRIETLNPAAERILGLRPGEAAERGFAELFLTREGFDEFTQLILDATQQRSGPARRVVQITSGEPRSISVATSYLRAARDGDPDAVSVIAVFSDITELRELRETELRMAKAAEEQHGRLQGAYREIEERNRALAAALRKIRFAQGFGVVLVMGLFVGVGMWTWRPLDLFAQARIFASEAGARQVAGDAAGELRTVTVKPRRASSSITLKGRLAPWRQVEVKSPAEGIVTSVDAAPGETVAEGQVLVRLDLSKLKRRHQSRRLALAKARKHLEKLKNWDKSPEMIKARRSFSKVQMNIDSSRSKIRKSRFLFEQGLIAAAEFEDAERQHRGRLLDFETAKEELEAVRARADAETLKSAELAVANARAEMLAAREALEDSEVVAPIAGTLLPPLRKAKELAVGARIRKGAALFRIGDFSRIAATSTADEIDVIKLKAGQKVTVTGNAFPGLKLKGAVHRVSSEADPKQKRKPIFHVFFLLDKLKASAQARIRPGMTAKMRIVTYSNPKALLVPMNAVRRRGGGHWLRVLDPASGKAQERRVRIGPTTMRKVEIASGLKAGERVVLP